MEYRGILKIGASSSYPLPLSYFEHVVQDRLSFVSSDHLCSFSLFSLCLCWSFFFLVSKETTSESLVDGVADRLTAMIPDNSLFNTFIHPSTHTEKGTLIDNPTTGLKCCWELISEFQINLCTYKCVQRIIVLHFYLYMLERSIDDLVWILPK